MFWGIESMVSTKPIRRMEDFKGLKMRVPQGMTAMLMQKLGASVVVLPGGEVYSALDKGVINTTDWATPSMNNRLGFYEVAKYTNYPGFHSMPLGDFTVNLKEWNKLPDDIKAILEAATREWCWDSYERIAVEDYKVVRELKNKGVEIIQWSDADLRNVRMVSREIWDEFSKKSPMTKKVLDSQKAWLKELGLID
jgi:TRAP-type mannitol/chloroaromatic compound transport system substrate-binding protein